jgi:hypothetical protein
VLEEYVPKGVSIVVLTIPPKWLNIFLDINTILCHYMEKAMTNRMSFMNDVKQGTSLSTVSTIIGPKAVFTSAGLLELLTAINKFATRVFIWSSMKRSTVEEIIDYLFHGLPLPYEILQ